MASRKRPRISVCLMVRDEERVLARCLRSVADLADELCIVDTGSRDRTPSIAARFSARLAEHTACNGPDGRIADFSQARNAALDLATGDWIFWLDADEVLLPGGAARLRRHARAARSPGLRITLRQGRTEWLSTRFFRRAPEHRFRGRIHEYVHFEDPSGPCGPCGIDRAIVLSHRPDKRGKEGSAERNIRLLQAELDHDPHDRRALFYLGSALKSAGHFAKAIPHFQHYLALGGNFPSERYMAAYSLSVCHLLLGDWQAAIASAFEALRLDPRHAETHCLLGDAYLRLGQPGFARQWFRSALACAAPPNDHLLFVDTALYGPYPRRRLRDCERLLRQTAPRTPSRPR